MDHSKNSVKLITHLGGHFQQKGDSPSSVLTLFFSLVLFLLLVFWHFFWPPYLKFYLDQFPVFFFQLPCHYYFFLTDFSSFLMGGCLEVVSNKSLLIDQFFSAIQRWVIIFHKLFFRQSLCACTCVSVWVCVFGSFYVLKTKRKFT